MICRMGHDFLAYALLDAVIDSYFPFVEQVGEVLNDIEEGVTGRPDQRSLNQLHAVRRTLLTVHRVMWRQRDAITQIMRDERSPFGEAVRVSCATSSTTRCRCSTRPETYREIGVGSPAYYSSVSNRLNEVMRTLTVISTIFIPLTFLVGVYGMNFDNMPELRTRWGYYVLWVAMLAVAAGLLYWFQRRGWLERTGRPARDDDDDA
jgi:magnesium transporter